MTLNYRLVRAARRDIDEISDYLADQAGLEKALEVVSTIMGTIATLSLYPMAGVRAEQFGAGLRKFPAGNYMIYYRPRRSGGIVVLHVFHGARDQRKAWRGRIKPKRQTKREERTAT